MICVAFLGDPEEVVLSKVGQTGNPHGRNDHHDRAEDNRKFVEDNRRNMSGEAIPSFSPFSVCSLLSSFLFPSLFFFLFSLHPCLLFTGPLSPCHPLALPSARLPSFLCF